MTVRAAVRGGSERSYGVRVPLVRVGAYLGGRVFG
ncbi:hypothetical protein BJ983_000556 [Actinomycetospora corticicola]|uniref:Uncharacterized protein n=1 Tax=Actinomycetospora corticicola TaxID=663602 RepID=A0A7Y9DSA5_9PSEU|nr:hypothetical protein [Actinomycetospora corticicola]